MRSGAPRVARVLPHVLLALAAALLATSAFAEDGYDLWLRYQPVDAPLLQAYRSSTTELVGRQDTPTLKAAHAELVRGLGGLLGVQPCDREECEQGEPAGGERAHRCGFYRLAARRRSRYALSTKDELVPRQRHPSCGATNLRMLSRACAL